MTIHMVRVFAAKDVTLEEANSAVDDWLDKHLPWNEAEVTYNVSVVNTTVDPDTGFDYFFGDFRFEWADDKIPILDDAEADLGSNVSWYRFCYHRCDHDEADPDGCPWSDTREGGSVPPEIPTCGGA